MFYLSLEEVIEIHQELIKQYGGKEGIRDKSSLESALMRPQCGYYETLSQEGAALFESLLFNHPFIDGNKRVAYTVLDIFLNKNGYCLSITPEAGEHFIRHYLFNLEPSSLRYEKILSWIRENGKPLLHLGDC
jgi:death-on-curing protein